MRREVQSEREAGRRVERDVHRRHAEVDRPEAAVGQAPDGPRVRGKLGPPHLIEHVRERRDDVASGRRGHLREHLLGTRDRAARELDSLGLLPQPRLAVRARSAREQGLPARITRRDGEPASRQQATRQCAEDRHRPCDLAWRRRDLRRDRLQRRGDQRREEERPDRLLDAGLVGAPLADASKGSSGGATSLDDRCGRPPRRRGKS